MNKTLKVHFYLKKRDDYVSGILLIYLRLTVPKAMEILERYKDHPQCVIKKKMLPVLSNAKRMNT